MLYHDSPVVGLSDESHHLGVSIFSEDDDLRFGVGLKLSSYPPLQLQHHRAGGIHYLDMVLRRPLISLRRFAVGPEQHGGIVQVGHLLMVEGDEPHPAQSLAFHPVVHDIAQTIELFA